jgi:hypothetical protein
MTDVKEHLEHNYVVILKQASDTRFLTVTIPKNIITGDKEEVIVYEIEEDKIIIYDTIANSKIEEIECPLYAARFLISTDITIRMVSRNIDTNLIVSYDKNGDIIKDNTGQIIKLLSAPLKAKDRKLEIILDSALRKYASDGKLNEIDERIITGFNLMSNRYIERT